MSAAELLADLRRRGVVLLPEGDQLRWRAPRGAMTESDLAALRAEKAAVLAELERARIARCGRLADACPELVRCSCGEVSWRPPGSALCLACEDEQGRRR